jgi:hypothetical protein
MSGVSAVVCQYDSGSPGGRSFGWNGMGVMAGRQMTQMRFGGVEVLVETVVVPGSEPTGAGDMAERVVDVFDRAREVIVGTADSTASMIREIGDKARPDRVEMEFGLGFSVKGNVIIAGASAEATLKVKLIYDAENAPEP